MIRSWLATHRGLALTVAAGLVLAVVVGTIAVASGGYPEQRMTLGDGAVWVSNDATQMVGRANTQIAALNTVVPGTSRSLDVEQSAGSVLLVDHGSNTVSVVDPATAVAGKAIALPPRQPKVSIVAGRAVIESDGTGQVWTMPASGLSDFDATKTPTVDLGGRIVSSIDDDGVLFAYSPTAHTVSRLNTVADDAVSRSDHVQPSGPVSSISITSVGGNWALLDSARGTLYTASGSIRLPSWLGTDTVVQQPASAGEQVYVASSTGMVAVPVTGGSVTTQRREPLGRPAQPVVVGGCLYAAWAGGSTWRRCGTAPHAGIGTLSSVHQDADLVFRVNAGVVVLNDTAHGTGWAVQHGNALIDNWRDFAQVDDTKKQVEQNTDDKPPVYDKQQKPPVAVDDAFGARAGTTNTLPVLLNDYDPNGDVLVIDSVTQLPAISGRLEIVAAGQQVQLVLPAGARGSLRFDYTVSDGRGGTASATVTVTVHPPEMNSPPIQAHTTSTVVAAGGRVSTQVLGDWYDPDGDPFYLAGATVAGPDSASSTPQGTVVYTDKGKGGSVKDVALVVSDGRAEGNGRLTVAVRPPGHVPIIPEQFPVSAIAGQELTISPLEHVRGGSGTVRLSALPDKPNVTLAPDFDAGTFRFSSSAVGTHLIDYAVTDGITTANGIVRVEVMAPPDAGSTPVTVPHTAFIPEQSTREVDVLSTDFDPAGGVLLITGVTQPSSASGVRVEVIEQRTLRVTLTKPLDGPLTFSYRVSNGLAEAKGTVRVVQIPRPAVRQPPIANPDTVSVRVGDVVDIPVLANDEQPDGDEITLDPTLVTPLPHSAGLLFASGSQLRYLAPKKPGDYTAVYRVDAADGQWSSAQVTIAVRELDAATNHAPIPQTVTARVFAGDTVRIPIPLSGIDPDGDSVALVGQDTNPEKGAVIGSGPGWIEYQAGDYSAGTDTFQYGVVDSLGARASGTIRVGIAPPQTGASNPIAMPDEVQARPGGSVSVQVLANDSDPDSSPLTITSVRATGQTEARAKIEGDLIRVNTPEREGRYGFIYQIRDQRGGTSANFLTVVVSKDAPLARPQVADTVLSLADILGRTGVDVNVLANVFFADGPVSSLKLALLPGYTGSAHVTASGRVHVALRNSRQIIPFSVTHPLDSAIVSYGFIWVPGYDDALPQLKPGAKPLSVQSERTLTIDLNDYVIAAGGKRVHLTDASTVHATHADGADLVRNDATLVYTSAKRYFGPASISFEVTDAQTPGDPGAHVATLVLPITVTPRHNQPPAFVGGQIDIEPGQHKSIDLGRLTRYQGDPAELAFRVIEPRPARLSLGLTGSELTVAAPEDAEKGSSSDIVIGVRDADNDGQAGRLTITVVPSTRPLAVPQPDSAVVRRGATTQVDVLANDGATNPFPSVPLRVIAVHGLAGGQLPHGVSITPSSDKSRLTVAVSSDAAAADANLQYEVADATGDADRYAWGTVRISVEDKPDPVSNLVVTGVADRTITLAWAAGAFNNSPIADYRVTLTRSDGSAPSTTCAATTCTVATPGNGPGNAVRIAVSARNGIGYSAATSYPDAVWSNVAPPAPVLDSSPQVSDQTVHVTWSQPAEGGASPVTGYRITWGSNSATVGGAARSYDVHGLQNGTAVTITVASMNDYYGPQPIWNSDSVTATPAGPPAWNSAPSAIASDDGTGTVTVDWGGGRVSPNGTPITGYDVVAYQDAAPGCSNLPAGSTHVDAGTTSTNIHVDPDQTWWIAVYAENAQGCTRSTSVPATPHTPPVTPTGILISMPSQSRPTTDHSYDAALSKATSDGTSYEFRFVADSPGTFSTDWAPIAVGDTMIATGAYGKHAAVQLRAVKTFPDGTTLRSDPSATVDAGVPVDTSAAETFTADATGGTFVWTQSPAGGDYEKVQYQCTGMTDWKDMGPQGSCTVTTPLPASATLTVRVTANGQTYEKMYRGSDQ
ncbi:MAG TPA: Ig-like domain-containing protein [Humibacter sp.]|nr:Ig-like domain-containing protein [Humibacter sp.]